MCLLQHGEVLYGLDESQPADNVCWPRDLGRRCMLPAGMIACWAAETDVASHESASSGYVAQLAMGTRKRMSMNGLAPWE